MYLLTVLSPAVPPGGTVSGLTLKIPIGVNRVSGLYVNPGIAYDITMQRSKGSKDVVVDSLRSSIGAVGYIPLIVERVADEIFTINMTNSSGAAADLNLTLVIE